ncbi:MAG: VCBS domain-containing protein, partial [Aeromonas sp.]
MFNSAAEFEQYLLEQGATADYSQSELDLPLADVQESQEDSDAPLHAYTVDDFIKLLEEEGSASGGAASAGGGGNGSSNAGFSVVDMDLKATIAEASFDTDHKTKPYDTKEDLGGVDVDLVPVLTGDSANLTEDAVGDSNHLETNGKVTSTGGDPGEQGFIPGTEEGKYGDLTIDPDGNWHYEADNNQSIIQGLKPGETLTEIIEVTSNDGKTHTDITITITGSDDVPVLTGDAKTVTEDGDVNGDGKLETSGVVSAVGGDAGEQSFIAGTQTGTFGDLTVDSNGNWTYEADNSQKVIQDLKPGETLTEIIKVTSSDGVTQTDVVITITGADDVPVLTGDQKTVTEDVVNDAGQLETSGVVTTVGGDAGEQNFVAGTEDGKYGDLTIDANGNWTYLADNSQKVIQDLKAGETLVETITVTSNDGVTQTDVVITIVGTDDVPTLTDSSSSVTEDVDTDHDGKLETSGTVTATGGDAGDQNFVSGTQTGSFGDLTVDSNGNWTYEADNTDPKIQGLKSGETLTESFTMTSSDGVTTSTVTITINGADDVPTLTGDKDTVTEDAVNDAGQLEASGVVTTVGGDAGEQNFVAGTEDGKYGDLTIDANGNWTYLADNSQKVIQDLKAGETLIETITVTNSDGVTQTDVVITIVGTDDVPTITGTDKGEVTEDIDPDGDGKLETSGTLTSTGGDAGEQGFLPSTETGEHGDLTIDKDGNWTFEADNKDPVIQGLKPGETLTESFTVTNTDGVTTTTVTITIKGADDVPVLTGDQDTVTEDMVNDAGQLEASGAVTTVGGDAGEQNFVAGTEDGKYGDLTIDANGNWTYLADNSQKVIQDLKAGETLIETITVTSSDGVTQTDVVITIVGTDDAPTLTTGSGSVTEDVDTDNDGKLETSG